MRTFKKNQYFTYWNILFLSLCFHIDSNAFDLPNSIPAPQFGLYEVAPDTNSYCPNWPTSANGGSDNCYYIDISNTNATDTNNPFGYPNKPRLSIPTSYYSGDYVEIHGGPYTGNTLQLLVNGSPSKPIWIKGIDNVSSPEIRREIVPNGSYVIFENLRFTGSTASKMSFRVRLGSSQHHMAVRDCLFEGDSTFASSGSAIGSKGDNTHLIHNLVWFRNTVRNYGSFDNISSQEQDYSAFSPDVYSDNVWILNNRAYNITGDGVIVGPSGGGVYASNIFIAGNIFHNTGENGIDIKDGKDIIVTNNKLYGFSPSSHSAGEGVIIHKINSFPTRVWVINNIVSDAGIGLITTGSDNTYFVGNIIRNIQQSGIESRGSTILHTINNTIDNTNIGITINSPQNITNNIITNSRSSDIIAGNTSVAAASKIDHNIIFTPSRQSIIKWGDSVLRSISGIKTYFNKCLSCYDNSPLIINNDTTYSILPGSPLIDTGYLDPSYALYLNLYGRSLLFDLDDNHRTIGASIDIGAIESTHTSGSPVKKPKSPDSVNISAGG